MYNDILDAVTRRLYELFGDKYEIYTDTVEQGLKEPCFFVQLLEPSEKPMIGRRSYRETGMTIQYLPGERTEVLRELNQVTDILMSGMEYIVLSDGSLLRGTDRRARPDMEEKMLTFFVNYNMFILEQQKKENSMETIEVEKGMVK